MLPLKDDIPSQGFPYVTVGLILVNSLIFILQVSMGSNARTFVTAFGATPFELTRHVDIPPRIPIPVSLTLVTSMFLHGGFFHIGGNMLYLWIFGDNVEDAMGSVRFMIFYLLCGVIASLTHVAIQPQATTPMVGASGAISGVLGAYLLLYPHARVITLIMFFYFIRIVKLSALFVLGFWIVLQLLSGTMSLGREMGRGGVAWFAHIGGFFAGMLLVAIFKKKRVRFGILDRQRWMT
ncbi:MAG: rhomboid family intramembrane serine protease [bacterium]